MDLAVDILELKPASRPDVAVTELALLFGVSGDMDLLMGLFQEGYWIFEDGHHVPQVDQVPVVSVVPGLSQVVVDEMHVWRDPVTLGRAHVDPQDLGTWVLVTNWFALELAEVFRYHQDTHRRQPKFRCPSPDQ